jgi:hypothetical protein
MENTFTHEITFQSYQWDEIAKNQIRKPLTKTLRFKELDQCDPSQRKLQFMIRPLFKYGQSITGKNELIAEPEILCNITEKYINEMMVITDSESITEIEVKELLNDNIAIMMFAEWLLNNKIMPFFLSLLALLQK